MSGAVQDAADLPDRVVVGRSGDSRRLHRQDVDADEVRPACPQGDIEGETEEFAADREAK